MLRTSTTHESSILQGQNVVLDVVLEDGNVGEVAVACQGSFSFPLLCGVRPCGWTVSGGGFDRGPSVLILELNGAQRTGLSIDCALLLERYRGVSACRSRHGSRSTS